MKKEKKEKSVVIVSTKENRNKHVVKGSEYGTFGPRW